MKELKKDYIRRFEITLDTGEKVVVDYCENWSNGLASHFQYYTPNQNCISETGYKSDFVNEGNLGGYTPEEFARQRGNALNVIHKKEWPKRKKVLDRLLKRNNNL